MTKTDQGPVPNHCIPAKKTGLQQKHHVISGSKCFAKIRRDWEHARSLEYLFISYTRDTKGSFTVDEFLSVSKEEKVDAEWESIYSKKNLSSRWEENNPVHKWSVWS